VPWIGVMLVGYGTAPIFQQPPQRRDARLFTWGAVMTTAFVVVRGIAVYGEPNPWQAQRDAVHTVIDFLNVTKYPPSLLFLLMTLGPTILLVPFLEHARGRIAGVLTVFGRVPFFYYVLHIPLIHLIFVGLSIARFGSVIPWMTSNQPMFPPPPPRGYMYSLPALYGITVLAVTILYFPCRWFAALKARRRDRWLSYL